MTGICYIVGAAPGAVPSFTRTATDLVIAADGGYPALAACGVSVDLLVGDMDSLVCVPDGIPTVRHPVRKDDTDMALALAEGYARGYRSFRIYGGMGGRSDHTFANYHLLLDYKIKGADVRLIDGTTEVRCLVNEAVTLTGAVGDTLSLFAYGGTAEGVTLTGLSYPLTDGVLTPDVPLGVSNEFERTSACVSVRRGALLCFHIRSV